MASERHDYGTANNTVRGENDAEVNGAPEGVGFSERMHKRLTVDVDTSWADLLLILCFFISGLVDGAVYNVWGSFVSMQTGNTVFVGLGLARVISHRDDEMPLGWIKSLTAILCFQLGSLFFSTFHRLWASPLRRWVIMASFGIQALLLAVAAILATTGVVSDRDSSSSRIPLVSPLASSDMTISQSYAQPHLQWAILLPLGILAFQSAGQAVSSRVLKYNELPTGVLTSLYVDLMSDPHLFTARWTEDSKRNRRIAAALVLVIGAICGGFCTNGSWLGVAGSMWIGVALKGLIVVIWVLWAPEPVLRIARDEEGERERLL